MTPPAAACFLRLARLLPVFRAAAIFPGLLLLCSCATENPFRSQLPAEVQMNPEAGRGGWLIVTVRLADGEKLPFVVDTGAGSTLLDQSLVPKLGKRLDTGTLLNFGKEIKTEVYAAPRLYLGNTLLKMTGDCIAIEDCKQMSTKAGRAVMGILGMDVLEHYCIQLDFAANRMRFLDDKTADKQGWGRAFPLADAGDGCCYIGGNLAGTGQPGSLIDTGDDGDGWLVPKMFQQWTNRTALQADGLAHSPDGVLGGETYTGLDLDRLKDKQFASGDGHLKFNGLGIDFLARNLVTLDFPNRTMYLKRTSAGPLIDQALMAMANTEGKSAAKYLGGLHKKGRLPGWTKDDKLATDTVNYTFHYPDSVTFDHVFKRGRNTSCLWFCSYPNLQPGPWKLQKAWRTDGHDRSAGRIRCPMKVLRDGATTTRRSASGATWPRLA